MFLVTPKNLQRLKNEITPTYSFVNMISTNTVGLLKVFLQPVSYRNALDSNLTVNVLYGMMLVLQLFFAAQ